MFHLFLDLLWVLWVVVLDEIVEDCLLFIGGEVLAWTQGDNFVVVRDLFLLLLIKDQGIIFLGNLGKGSYFLLSKFLNILLVFPQRILK